MRCFFFPSLAVRNRKKRFFMVADCVGEWRWRGGEAGRRRGVARGNGMARWGRKREKKMLREDQKSMIFTQY